MDVIVVSFLLSRPSFAESFLFAKRLFLQHCKFSAALTVFEQNDRISGANGERLHNT